MPELPEVETIRRQVASRIIGRTIVRAEIRWPKLLRSPQRAEALRTLRGRRILGVDRRGKHLIFTLSAGCSLVSHLGMTGGYRLLAPRSPAPAHTLALLVLDDGFRLGYVDSRRFGRMRVAETATLAGLPELASLGPDALSRDLTPRVLAGILARTRRPLKECLLDQKQVAGIGNIYACETLYRAGLSPHLPACELDEDRVRVLWRTVRRVLREAIRQGGTSIQTFADSHGSRGGYGPQLRVYGREGEECLRCGNPILRHVLGGRSTYHCPRCQPWGGSLPGRLGSFP